MGEFKRNKYKFSNMSVIAETGNEVVELRENEISLLVKELFLYKVLLRDLVNHFPTDKDRNLILNLAYYIIEEDDIFENFKKMRELPYGRISRKTKIPKSFLEMWQDYIITYVLIISNPNFTYIQNYIKVELDCGEVSNVVRFDNKNQTSHRGIVIKVTKKSVIILTNSGQFHRIKKSEGVSVGQETHGFEKIGVTHYKFHIIIGLLFIVLLCGAAYRSYTKVSSTVVFTCSSQVKLQINKKNRVIYAYSSTDKGNEMISKVNPMDRNIDDILKEFMEYAKENNMITKDGFIIVITGRALKYDDIDKTDEYIVDNNLSAQINNGGSLHNVYESVQIKRKGGE